MTLSECYTIRFVVLYGAKVMKTTYGADCKYMNKHIFSKYSENAQ